MAVPIDFLSPADRARLARSEGVATPDGGTYRNGVKVSAADTARASATRRQNDFYDAQATGSAIRPVGQIQTSQISTPGQIQTNPISFNPAPAPQQVSIFDNRAVQHLNQIDPVTGMVPLNPAPVLTPSAPPTAEQVQIAAQQLRAVNGILPGRTYTDEALAKATPSQIVAEAGTLNSRIAFENMRKEQANKDALTSATASMFGGGTAAPTAPATPSSIVVGGQTVDQPMSGTTYVDGKLWGQPPAPPASAAPATAAAAAAPTAPATAPVSTIPVGPARTRAVAAIAKGRFTPEQAASMLKTADDLDDPTGEVANKRRIELETNLALAHRGADSKYYDTPAGKEELALRQKQLDNIHGQTAAAQTQLDAKIKAVDTQFGQHILAKVAGALPGVTDKNFLQRLNSPGMTPQGKYDMLVRDGYIAESDSDKAKLKSLAETRTYAEREYQSTVGNLQRLSSELVQSNPRLNFNPFGVQAPAGVTAAPVSAFGAAPAAPAASPFSAQPAAPAATATPVPSASPFTNAAAPVVPAPQNLPQSPVQAAPPIPVAPTAPTYGLDFYFQQMRNPSAATVVPGPQGIHDPNRTVGHAPVSLASLASDPRITDAQLRSAILGGSR